MGIFPLSSSRKKTVRVGLVLLLLMAPLRFAPVHGASMEPTLFEGDLVCFYLIPHGILPSRGDVVVFQAPTESDKLFVKRLVGLPGDYLRFKDGQLRINGLRFELPEGAVQPEFELSAWVPDGHFYAIGDHSAVSYDSRSFGPVDQDRLVGSLIGF
jgi:signal peptidase I